MHGRSLVSEETSRLEQRQPGAQPGGDVVRGGSDRCLKPGHGVLRAGQREQQRLAAAARRPMSDGAADRLPQGGRSESSSSSIAGLPGRFTPSQPPILSH